MPLNAKLAKLHRMVVKLRETARTTDSKSEARDATVSAADLQLKLQKLCPHDYVVCLCSAYRGSYFYDYKDGRDEGRLCIRCGINESALREEDFKTLTTTPFSRFELGRGFDREPLDHDLNALIAETQTRGYAYFGKEWCKAVDKQIAAKQEEEQYQRFKAKYLDRLKKELTT